MNAQTLMSGQKTPTQDTTSAPPPPVSSTDSARFVPRETSSAAPPEKPSSRPGDIRDEMRENLKRARAAKMDKEPSSSSRQNLDHTAGEKATDEAERRPRTVDDLAPDQRENRERAQTAKAEAATASAEKSSGAVLKDTLQSKKTPKTLDDLSPEQKEKYHRALAARKAKSTEQPSSASLSEDRSSSRQTTGSTGEAEMKKRPRRLEDMTDEEREAYMEARERRKEKERLATRAKNMSGLTIDEKEALSAPCSPSLSHA